MSRLWWGASVLFFLPSVTSAAPGLDDVVYGATVVNGQSEIETRYGRLTGAQADGKDAFVVEFSHGFSSHVYGAVLVGFEREPRGGRQLETLGVESVFTLGHIKSLDLDTAIYFEYEHGVHGPENVETKLLLEHQKKAFDARLNLVAERAFQPGAPVEFHYAASVYYAVVRDDMSLGAEAFGDLGTSHGHTTHAQHFIGPSANFEIDHFGGGELELRTGYLFAVDRARGEAKGQMRVGIEFEF